MREIKFRAWDEENKRMLDGDALEEMGAKSGLSYGKFFIADTERNGDWNEYIPMQFTGLHDKNGKEIYEDDIIRFRSHPQKEKRGRVMYTKDAKFVAMSQDEFEKSRDTYSITSFSSMNYCEVIGNIYENPELLGENKTP